MPGCARAVVGAGRRADRDAGLRGQPIGGQVQHRHRRFSQPGGAERLQVIREFDRFHRHALRREMLGQGQAAVVLPAVRDQHASGRRSRLAAQVELAESIEPLGAEAMPEDLAHVVRRHLVAVVDTGLALPGLVQQVHFAQEQACRHHRREHRDRFHLGLPRGERGHGRAKPEAGQRHALDLRGALQPAHRLHHLGHPVLGAHPAAGVARIAGAQIIEAQHRDAAQGQAVGELAHRLVQPHRLVAEGIAKDDPVVAAGGVQPPGMSVENDRFHFGVRSLMDESLWPLTEALRFARGAPPRSNALLAPNPECFVTRCIG